MGENNQNRAYKADIAELKRLEQGAEHALKQEHTRKAKSPARAKARKAKQEPAATLSEEFRKRAEASLKKVKKRREERGKGYGRERD